MEKTKLYKVGFFTSIGVIIALAIALTVSLLHTTDEVEATEDTTEYSIDDEISVGRLAYGAYYDGIIEEVSTKFYSIFFRGNDTFEFYDIDHSKLQNTDEITKETPKTLAYTVEIDDVLEVGTGVEHLKSLDSYLYGTVFSATYTTATGNRMPATIVLHQNLDFITIYLHNDGDIDKFGDDENLSTITISLENDIPTSRNLFSIHRLKDITTIGEALYPPK